MNDFVKKKLTEWIGIAESDVCSPLLALQELDQILAEARLTIEEKLRNARLLFKKPASRTREKY